jgi:hypothetical protein
LAYRNVRQLAYRTVPLVRRELDKQLTKMILVQGVFNFFFLLPIIITNGLLVNTNLPKDSMAFGELQLANSICFLIFYLYFAVRFIYIYLTDDFYVYLEPILYIHLCIRTISSATYLCTFSIMFESMSTT